MSSDCSESLLSPCTYMPSNISVRNRIVHRRQKHETPNANRNRLSLRLRPHPRCVHFSVSCSCGPQDAFNSSTQKSCPESIVMALNMTRAPRCANARTADWWTERASDRVESYDGHLFAARRRRTNMPGQSDQHGEHDDADVEFIFTIMFQHRHMPLAHTPTPTAPLDTDRTSMPSPSQRTIKVAILLF